MNEDQHQRADEFVRRLQVHDVQLTERDNGYDLGRPARTRFGFVRYNVKGGNAGSYTVYAYPQFDDPEGRFLNNSGLRAHNPYSRQWHFVFSPDDEDAVTYAVRVLKSACDRREPR